MLGDVLVVLMLVVLVLDDVDEDVACPHTVCNNTVSFHNARNNVYGVWMGNWYGTHRASATATQLHTGAQCVQYMYTMHPKSTYS